MKIIDSITNEKKMELMVQICSGLLSTKLYNKELNEDLSKIAVHEHEMVCDAADILNKIEEIINEIL